MLDNDFDMYNCVYKELAEMIGRDAALKIYVQFRGQQISFPTRLYSTAKVAKNVLKEYDGRNLKQLAKKYGYSEKTVRRMLNSDKKKN